MKLSKFLLEADIFKSVGETSTAEEIMGRMGLDDLDFAFNISLTADPPKLDVAKKMLDAGADINNTKAWYWSSDGLTPLLACIAHESLDAIKFLVDAGADVNKSEPIKGFSPLRTAIAKGNMDIFNLLMDNGADPDIKNKGFTAITDFETSPNPIQREMVRIMKQKMNEKQ